MKLHHSFFLTLTLSVSLASHFAQASERQDALKAAMEHAFIGPIGTGGHEPALAELPLAPPPAVAPEAEPPAVVQEWQFPAMKPLIASEEGLHCVHHLKKSTGKLLGVIGATTGTAALAAVTVTGAVLTAPTVIGPILFGEMGGIFTLFAGTGTGGLIDSRIKSVKLGKLLDAAYTFRDLKVKNTEKRIKSAKRLIAYRDKKVAKLYPDTRINLEQLADEMIALNESGHFCKATTFKPRGTFLPAWVGSLRPSTIGLHNQLAQIIVGENPIPTKERIDAFQASHRQHVEYLADCERAIQERAAADYQAIMHKGG